MQNLSVKLFSDNIGLLKNKGLIVEYDNRKFKWFYVTNYPIPEGYTKQKIGIMVLNPYPDLRDWRNYSFYINQSMNRTSDNSSGMCLIDYEDVSLKEKGWLKLNLSIEHNNQTSKLMTDEIFHRVLESLYLTFSYF